MVSKQKLNTKAGLYFRLSKDDERAGESLSIENPKYILCLRTKMPSVRSM